MPACFAERRNLGSSQFRPARFSRASGTRRRWPRRGGLTPYDGRSAVGPHPMITVKRLILRTFRPIMTIRQLANSRRYAFNWTFACTNRLARNAFRLRLRLFRSVDPRAVKIERALGYTFIAIARVDHTRITAM